MNKPLKECRVLVTSTSFGMNDPTLRTTLAEQVGEVVYNQTGKPLTSVDLAQIIGSFDGYIAGLDQIDRSVIEAADQLKVIARYGVGVDEVDLQAARDKGIIVTNTPGANSVSVAELAVGLMIALARNIPAASQATKARSWPRMHGLSLEGKTVGLLGFGAIGRQVARRLSGFDCTILAYDPFVAEEAAAAGQPPGVHLVSLEKLAGSSDFLSLHCPLTDETKGIVNAAFLDQMKPGAFLINTARGGLIDEEALLRALQQGKLRGAALDVFAKQPPDPANPLLAMSQVIATPHTGAHTDGATNAMGWMALDDCLAVLRGESPRYRVV